MNENIDLTNILKDCPQGWKFYTPVWGEVTFIEIKKNKDCLFPICICTTINSCINLTRDGRYLINRTGTECILFPSKDQRDWSKFTAPWLKNDSEYKFHEGDWVVYNNDICKIVKREEGCNKLVTVFGIEKELVNERNLSTARFWTIEDAKDGDVLVHSSFMFDDFIFIYNNTSILQAYCYYSNERNLFIIEDRGHHCHWNMQEVTPATKEQRDLLFQKIKEAGYKWNVETKTLEKLIKHKFDPKTLKPFDKVLIRDRTKGKWSCSLFSHIDNELQYNNVCTNGLEWKFCIPYNDDTKYLVGTNEEAPEYYRYWEN